MEFGVAGTTEYEKGGRGGRPPESAGGYPGSDLHLRDVLSVRTDRCAGQGKGEDGPSKRPQLKVIKRIMYGRNSFELLKAKVLLHEQFRCEIN